MFMREDSEMGLMVFIRVDCEIWGLEDVHMSGKLNPRA